MKTSIIDSLYLYSKTIYEFQIDLFHNLGFIELLQNWFH